jgi:hypothetical protein
MQQDVAVFAARFHTFRCDQVEDIGHSAPVAYVLNLIRE